MLGSVLKAEEEEYGLFLLYNYSVLMEKTSITLSGPPERVP